MRETRTVEDEPCLRIEALFVARRSAGATPFVVAAVHVSGHTLAVTFSDGLVKQVDFSGWLNGPVFEPPRDVDTFRRFHLDGWTVAWPNGADIAPETLQRSEEREQSAA